MLAVTTNTPSSVRRDGGSSRDNVIPLETSTSVIATTSQARSLLLPRATFLSKALTNRLVLY